MNTRQLLEKIEQKIKPLVRYANVLPYDKFLLLNCTILPKPIALIVNTRPSDHSGSHWFSLIITEYNEIYYFNSLRCSPRICQSLFRKLNTMNMSIYYMKCRIQSEYSKACGVFCLVFLMHMLLYKDFTKFTSLFHCHKYVYNETLAMKLYHEYFD